MTRRNVVLNNSKDTNDQFDFTYEDTTSLYPIVVVYFSSNDL